MLGTSKYGLLHGQCDFRGRAARAQISKWAWFHGIAQSTIWVTSWMGSGMRCYSLELFLRSQRVS